MLQPGFSVRSISRLARLSRFSEARSGITLLEILISMFVIAIGLLGVAAMLPVGHFYVKEAEKSDRSAAMSEAANNLLQIRSGTGEWLDPGTIPAGNFFVIDPLGQADPANNPNDLAGSVILLRHNLNLSRVLAEHWFVAQDDLIFNRPPEPPPPTPFSPTDIVGLDLWLDASDLNLAGDAVVSNWPDKSGKGHDANVVNGDPNFLRKVLNNKSVVGFDGNDRLNTTYNFDNLSLGYTILSVARYTGGDSETVIGSTTRDWEFGFRSNKDEKWYAQGWINNAGSGNTNWHLHVGTITNDVDPKAAFWKDGTLLTSNDVGSTNTNYKPGKISFGGRSGNCSECSKCEVAEVIIYDKVLTDAERTSVSDYLFSKWLTPDLGVDLSATEQFFIIDGAANPLKRAYAGDYSWLATLVSKGNGRYKLSIAVFFKRNLGLLDPVAWPGIVAERTVLAAVQGDGYGGGEVKLGTGTPADTAGLKSNRWILLFGASYCQWYRMTAVGDGYVSLEGPDIAVPAAVTNAVLFDQVISVTESDIEIK